MKSVYESIMTGLNEAIEDEKTEDKKFGVSKSTVHKDVSERLIWINPALASEVRKVLDVNKAEIIFWL
mgnify:CR=1 FL=1